MRPYGDRRGTPRPPREIELEMEAAGRTGDDVALGLARARYTAWLAEQGYRETHHHGTTRPDEAVQ